MFAQSAAFWESDAPPRSAPGIESGQTSAAGSRKSSLRSLRTGRTTTRLQQSEPSSPLASRCKEMAGKGASNMVRPRDCVRDRLRVGTLNVSSLAGRLPEVLAILKSQQLDVLALQETRVANHSRSAVVAAARREGFETLFLDRLEGSIAGGLLVFSRSPMTW